MSVPLPPGVALGGRPPQLPPRLNLLLPAAGRAWLLLATLALLAALIWRLGGGAPPLAAVLDGAGLALWLSAWWLAPAWDRLLRQPQQHLLPMPHAWPVPRRNTAWLVVVALLLSLAPAALLLAYDPRARIADFSLFDDFNLYLPAGLWVIGSLLLAGPVLVIGSLLVLHWGRGLLGRQWGAALWLAVTALAHAPLLTGAPLWPWPLTLGGYADWAAQTVAHTRIDTMYLDNLLAELVRGPLLALLAAVLLCGLAQWPIRPRGRLWPGWFAALAAVSLVAGHVVAQTWRWGSEPAQLYPGDWRTVFALGLSSLWLAWWLQLIAQRRQLPRLGLGSLAWAWYAAAAWLCLTLPQLVADQVDRSLLLAALAAALPLATAGVLLLRRAAQLAPPLADIALAALLAGLILPWPLAGRLIAPALLGHQWLASGLLDPAGARQAQLGLAALVVLCLLLWPWRLRPRRRPAAKAAELS